MEATRHSEHCELRGFAKGLQENKAEAQAGSALPEGNEPTEGYINKLNLVKHSMNAGRLAFVGTEQCGGGSGVRE